MLDINTVGAGGGSIASVDSGGSLRVGPASAGAVPGPACYGVGTDATVTDAHVVLGRIAPDQLAGGEMRIDPAAAARAIVRVGKLLGLTAVATAEAIIRVANSNMERAIRSVSVERGEDPRDFALVAFGGCGGLHACELAEELGICTVIVPRLAGALSALGMLLADRTRDYSAAALGESDLEPLFLRLEQQASTDLPGAMLSRFADVRYAGQSYELSVPWLGAATPEAFHSRHQQVYGYSDAARPIQTVTVRVRAVLRVARPSLAWRGPATEAATSAPGSLRRVRIGNKWRELTLCPRETLTERNQAGPLLVADYGSTTVVPPFWTATLDEAGSLILDRAPVSAR